MRFLSALLTILVLAFGVNAHVHAQTLPEPGEWAEVPGTELDPHLPTVAELGADWCNEIDSCDVKNGHVGAWTGGAWVQSERRFYFIRPGGHSDGAGADSYTFDLNTETWARSEPVQHLTGQLDDNGRCPWPAYGAPSQHTYDGVVDLGDGRFLHLGRPGGCGSADMNPGATAFVVDTTTEPWTWVQHDHLKIYTGANATAVQNGVVYIVQNKGRWAEVDAQTLEILRSGTTGGFGSQMSAGDINADGLFCFHNQSSMRCSDTASFGSFNSVAIPDSLQSGKSAVVAHPDGRFVIWSGGPLIQIFNPSDGAWEEVAPATGPSGTTNVYSKFWYDSAIDSFVGFASSTQGVWVFRMPDAGDPPPPPPAEEPVEEDEITCGVAEVHQIDSASFTLNIPCEITALSEGDEDPVEPEEPTDPPSAGDPAIGPLWPGPVETTDFASRCATAGVVFCQDFTNAIPTGGSQDEGVFVGGSTAPCAITPTVQNGYLRMYVPSECGSGGGGNYFIDLFERAGVSFGSGQSVFIQFRQYMPAPFVQQTFVMDTGRLTKPKQLIVSETGNSSCTPNHMVLTGQNWRAHPDRRTPRLYGRCGRVRLVEDRVVIDGQVHWDSQPHRQCWTIENCVEYPADAWVTYQIGLEVPAESYIEEGSGDEVWDVRVRLWATTDGQPTELVIDTIHAKPRLELPWGRVWFTPFMTNKDPAQVHEPTFTDYDELIVSTQRVPDPS